MKKRLNTARRVRKILRNERRKCKTWIAQVQPVSSDPCEHNIELAFRMRDFGNGLELNTEVSSDVKRFSEISRYHFHCHSGSSGPNNIISSFIAK